MRAILGLFPPEATRAVLRELLAVVSGEGGGKWKTKAGALDSVRRWVEEKSKKAERAEYIAAELGHILPTVENAMHDTKSEVSFCAPNSIPSRLFSTCFSGIERCCEMCNCTLRYCTQPRLDETHPGARPGYAISHQRARYHQGAASSHLLFFF